MKAESYREYIRVLKEYNENGKIGQFSKSHMDLLEEDEIIVTVKNYNMKDGLSKVIHEAPLNEDVFWIKGPMGKGLGIEKSGTHIAFTAGTGILVFIDLVAFLVRKNLNLLTEEE